MPVTFTRTADSNLSSVANVTTYSNLSIGTEHPDRIVVALVLSYYTSASINSCTIDYGIGAQSMTAGSQAQQGTMYARAFYLKVPTGTTATFVVTYGSSPDYRQNAIIIYNVGDAEYSSSGADNTSDINSDPLTTGSITIASNGGWLGGAVVDGPTTTKTWTNATDDYSENVVGYRAVAAYSTTPGTVTITCSGATNEDGALSWLLFTDLSPSSPPVYYGNRLHTALYSSLIYYLHQVSYNLGSLPARLHSISWTTEGYKTNIVFYESTLSSSSSSSYSYDIIIEAGVGSSPSEAVYVEANDVRITKTIESSCAFFKNAFCEPTKTFLNTTKRCNFTMQGGTYKVKREVNSITSAIYSMSLLIPYQSSESFFIVVVNKYTREGVRYESDNIGWSSMDNLHILTVNSVVPSYDGMSGPIAGDIFYTRIHANFAGHVGMPGNTTDPLVDTFIIERNAKGELFLFGKSEFNITAFSEEMTGEDSQYLWDSMMNLTVDYPYINTPFIVNESVNGTIKYTYKWKEFSGSYIEDDEYLKFNNNENNLPELAKDKKYSVFCGWS